MALDTLTEPHQLTATLNCVTSVARALVRPDKLYPTGRSHVLPLLQLVLPGIDPNDFRKAMVSTYHPFCFHFSVFLVVQISGIVQLIGSQGKKFKLLKDRLLESQFMPTRARW